MRKLASIRKIANITPIVGADAIETATVDGWTVVVKKNEFKIGDRVVYLEIDSWVPNELAPFLSKGKEPREFNGVRGERLRSIRLRGQLSQGLLLPIDVAINAFVNSKFDEGQELSEFFTPDVDLTELLNIQKWEAPLPACLVGQADGVFPSWIRKTDEERIQNLYDEVFRFEQVVQPIPVELTAEQAENGIRAGRLVIVDGVLNTFKPVIADPNALFEVSTKLDGSSMTAYVRYSQVFEQVKTGVCSRNLMLKVNEENADNTFVKMFVESGLQQLLHEFYAQTGRSIAVQGELIGEGIQNNREGIKGHQFYIFKIFDIDNQVYLSPKARREIADFFIEKSNFVGNQRMINHVPVLHESVRLADLGITDIQSALKYAEGPSLNNAVREGVVFKRIDGGFSFKAISNLYLLNGGD